mgnify:CR=1 FL=1
MPSHAISTRCVVRRCCGGAEGWGTAPRVCRRWCVAFADSLARALCATYLQDGHSGDPRTPDKLVDGTNVTCNDHHMWLIPFNAGEKHVLRMDLGSPQPIAGVRIYNYNKSPEDVRRGVRTASLLLDGVAVSQVRVGLMCCAVLLWCGVVWCGV